MKLKKQVLGAQHLAIMKPHNQAQRNAGRERNDIFRLPDRTISILEKIMTMKIKKVGIKKSPL